MRILVGLTEIAGQIPVFAEGFRKLGHQVTTVIRKSHRFNTDIKYDLDLGYPVSWPNLISQSVNPLIKLPIFALNRIVEGIIISGLIAKHDIFVFQWARSSLFPGYLDYPLLKKLGKKIISLQVGSDVRDGQAYRQWYEGARKYLDVVSFPDSPLINTLKSVRTNEIYSDLILSVPNQAVIALRPYDHFFVPLNIADYPFNLPGRDIPIVVHAPSVKKDYKGTKFILKALDQLKAEGVLFEIRFLEGVSHKQLKAEMVNADVIIDEMFFPLHGKLTVEALASGCAVATGDREDYESFPPERPIWYINPENVYSQLKELITNKDLRIRLAIRGRKYVEKYYDHVKVAQRILDGLDTDSRRTYDHYPTFFASDYCLPKNEKISNNLKRMTNQVVRRWGLPKDVDPKDLIRRGLMADMDPDDFYMIPRWNSGNK